MNPVVIPSFVGTGANGTDQDVFQTGVNPKFSVPFQRRYKQLGLDLEGRTTIYGSGDIVYNGPETSITISGNSYSVGVPADIKDLISLLKILDIGFWYLNSDDLLTVEGFQTYGDITQEGAAVCSPDTSELNDTEPEITDIFRELALKTGANAQQPSSYAWVPRGNSFPTEEFIGTKNEFDFPIRTFNIERARVLTTGEFLIGIASTPLGTLHVKGQAGQSPLYVSNDTVSDSLEYRNDGSIFRDGLLYSLGSGTDTSWGQEAHIGSTTHDHNSVYGWRSARFLNPGAGGQNNVIIGASTADGLILGTDLTLLGFFTDVASDPLSGSFAIGSHATITASNQGVFGSTLMPILDVWFGKGATSTSPAAFTIHGTDATGSNVAAGNFTFAIGRSRGNATAGKWIWQVTKSGSSGGTQQALYTALTLDSTNLTYSPHGTSAGNTFESRYLELVANGTDYIGWKGPDARTTNTSLILVLPATDPTAGQVMTFGVPSSGVSTGTWTSVGGGGTVTSVSGTTNRITSTGGATPVIDISASYVGQSSITTVGTLTSGATGAGFTIALGTSTITGALPVANGGTAITSYAVGDIIYASGATTLSKLADVATGNALISGGITTAPSWGKISLTTTVSGILPIANGGTNKSTIAANKFWVALTTDTLSETPWFDVAEQTLATTPTFTAGTAPSGSTTHTYRWHQVGNICFIRINLIYSVAGATVTSCLIPKPSDVPNPAVPTGFTGASAKLYFGGGAATTGITSVGPNLKVGYLQRNAADTGFEFGIDSTSLSSKIFYVDMWYPVT